MQNGFTLERVQYGGDRQTHVIDYIVLAGIVVVYAMLFFGLAYSSMLRLEIAVMAILTYLLWGLWHHARTHALTWNIVIEYHAFSAFLSTMCVMLFIFL